MKHMHHIVPKHMGGTDDPSNLIELTVEEHAEAHRVLYEKYGHWEDKLAWQGLAGLIDKQELVKQMLSEAAKKGSANQTGKKRGKYNMSGKYTKRENVGGWSKTGGTKWYHNPNDSTQKGCYKDGQVIPEGWVRGQGKKAKNPGLNFHVKKTK